MKEQRNVIITLKLTASEKAMLDKYCEETGLSMSAAIRMSLLTIFKEKNYI
jgi:antitoxin component of RelBE/YafQ-DinJ toxin-antitoxin module